MKSLYHFGPFALDPNKRALFRQGKPVTLTPKAFDVLLYLAQNPNRVVSKEELLKSVWAGSFVEEGNLTQNVFLLRKVLSEESGESGLIVTVPRVGYQFAAEVATIAETVPVPVGTSGKMLLQGVESTTHIVIEEEIESDSHLLQRPQLQALPPSRWRWYVLALIPLAIAAALLFRPTVPSPTVTQIRQITHLGTVVHNTKILSDGPRIYFRAWDGKDRALRYVSPEGGEVFSVDKAFPQMDVDDLSPSGSEFLVVDLADQHSSNTEDVLPSVWRVAAPSGSPRPVGRLRAREASWSRMGAPSPVPLAPTSISSTLTGVIRKNWRPSPAILSTSYGPPTVNSFDFPLPILTAMPPFSGRPISPPTPSSPSYQNRSLLSGSCPEAGPLTDDTSSSPHPATAPETSGRFANRRNCCATLTPGQSRSPQVP